MLSPEVIGYIRQFMNRTQLQGSEVQVFNHVMMALAIEENEARKPNKDNPSIPAEVQEKVT